MPDISEISMKLAPREWARLVYTSVVKSLAKTITEPITNSDTSYKRKHAIPDVSGLVERALQIEKGSKFDLSTIKKELKGVSPERSIEIHLYTAQGHAAKPRTCDVVDFAEGLSTDVVKAVFSELAADKSEISKGRPGRSLFGRGVSDVLIGHQPSIFASLKDQILSRAEFVFDHKKDSGPRIRISSDRSPRSQDLKEMHLRKGENGSCVRFTLHPDCRIPDEGTLLPVLSQFYMLRLINSDPNVHVKVLRYRSSGKVPEDELEYDFPLGDVIGKFSFELPCQHIDKSLAPIRVDAIVARAEDKTSLPGADAGDQRANGLLIVDEKDAVLDLTFLPQYEGAPYLTNVFGIIRLTNVREVLSWYLNNGKDSPLTVTRDGFDTKHEFTKFLFKEMAKRLESIYNKEEERFNKSHVTEVSAETRHRINDALKELNKFLKQIGEGESTDGPPEVSKPDKVIQFLPQNTKLYAGRDRYVRLYVLKSKVKPNTSIIYDSSNPRIEITPLSNQIKDGIKSDEYVYFPLAIKSETLHENGKITALAEGLEGVLEATLEVVDVTSGPVIVSPADIEFRPRESRGLPNRENNLALYVNPIVVPVGRKIKLDLERAHGTIGVCEKGHREIVNSTSVIFEKSAIISEYNVGRILIPWRGNGWGQSAKVIAETKRVDGTVARTEGRIVIEQAEDSEGMIKDVKYTPLENQKRSDLVDGIIYLNSNHYLNRTVFGDAAEYKRRLDSDRTAQYKFSELIVEQSVFRLAEEAYMKGKLSLTDSPVTSIREFVDQKTHELAPKITRVFITK